MQNKLLQSYRNTVAIKIICIGIFFLLCIPFVYGENKKINQNNMEMLLSDSIFLVLRKNRNIKSAYLDRVAQKYDLEVAEAKFKPILNIDLSTQYSSIRDAENKTSSITESASAKVTQNIQTGGQFVFAWTGSGEQKRQPSRQDSYGNSFGINFTQPLLKGGGFDIATASVDIARFNEQINILSLKSTIMDTVTSAIFAYRSFLQAKRQLEISRQAVERAKKLLEINKALIASGRMATVDIIQAEADLAGREFAILTVQNNLDAARLSLIKLLDIGKDTQIAPVEEKEIELLNPDIALCRALAFANRPDYLQTYLQLQIAEKNLLLAKNNRLWSLSLNTAYNLSSSDNAIGKAWDFGKKDWNVGFKLNIPIGDLTINQTYITAKINMEKAKIRLDELRETIEVDVINALREVSKALKQLELAKKLRELAEKKLDAEMEKLKVGLSSNFQIITFQNDLTNAQNSELDAVIAYLNALTSLDKTIGTTLDTWKIELNRKEEQ
jgi:outer membrane protein TolC